jgi:hypothetical protein
MRMSRNFHWVEGRRLDFPEENYFAVPGAFGFEPISVGKYFPAVRAAASLLVSVTRGNA